MRQVNGVSNAVVAIIIFRDHFFAGRLLFHYSNLGRR
jgi:hypothetical protein